MAERRRGGLAPASLLSMLPCRRLRRAALAAWCRGPAMIGDRDEELHPIGPAEHWQESWYFSWADARHDAFGLTRIGLRLNEQRMDGLVIAIRGYELEFVYGALGVRHRGPWVDQGAARG